MIIILVYASISNYDKDKVEIFYKDFEKLLGEDHVFLMMIIGELEFRTAAS